ncbi:hypothetical protein F2Q70_00040017 [Brassica cretica]|uniref:Uncharacterized protein n=1 Tax=Brassica cretica TaxID=69181 RepID=A0A8S9K5V2_BRACR|nr:hypothetical protein F2Q70_00040017 [Brassica cretica]
MMKVILVNNNGKLKRRTSHGGKRSRQSLNPGNGDDRAGSGCTVAAAAEEEDSYRRSSLDNRLRKDAVAGMVDTREAEVEDILRDAAEDIPAAAAPMDNQEADSEIGILLVRLFSNQILESIKDQRIES